MFLFARFLVRMFDLAAKDSYTRLATMLACSSLPAAAIAAVERLRSSTGVLLTDTEVRCNFFARMHV